MLTPAQRSLRARLGGLATASRHDTGEMTKAARAAFMARFEREVDPSAALPAAERLRRADAAKKLYFSRLAFKSAEVRRQRGTGTVS